jgi:hypothetical protein
MTPGQILSELRKAQVEDKVKGNNSNKIKLTHTQNPSAQLYMPINIQFVYSSSNTLRRTSAKEIYKQTTAYADEHFCKVS